MNARRAASPDLSAWDALPGMVALLDEAGGALHVNTALAAFARREPARLLGRAWQELLDADSRHQLLDRPNPLSLFVAHRHARQGRGPGWGWRYPTERNLKRALRAA